MSRQKTKSAKIHDDEFPILCDTCLGENPFIRMTREPHGKACKICDRPFTVFRWKPGPRARYKKTELCHTCAKMKNVCQTCVLDLQYGLPVQVRDSALEDHEKTKMPESDVNLQVMVEGQERAMSTVGSGQAVFGRMEKPSKMLERLSRSTPYYRRNLPHLCSFYAKGTCNRGSLCPFRHEMPTTGPLAQQNIKDRFYGQNDPVAQKMMGRAQEQVHLDPPEDTSITTLWLGGLEDDATESQVRGAFKAPGDITSVRILAVKSCAFVTFTTRAAAEKAAEEAGKLTVGKIPCRVAWGKRQSKSPPGVAGGLKAAPPGLAPAPPAGKPATPYYPSMDPRNMSARLPQ